MRERSEIFHFSRGLPYKGGGGGNFLGEGPYPSTYYRYLYLTNLNLYLTNLYLTKLFLTNLWRIQNALIRPQLFRNLPYFETQAVFPF